MNVTPETHPNVEYKKHQIRITRCVGIGGEIRIVELYGVGFPIGSGFPSELGYPIGPYWPDGPAQPCGVG